MTVVIDFQLVSQREGVPIKSFRADGGSRVRVYGTCDEYTATALVMKKAQERNEDGNGEFTVGDEVVYPVNIEVTKGVNDPVEDDEMADANYHYTYHPIKGLVEGKDV